MWYLFYHVCGRCPNAKSVQNGSVPYWTTGIPVRSLRTRPYGRLTPPRGKGCYLSCIYYKICLFMQVHEKCNRLKNFILDSKRSALNVLFLCPYQLFQVGRAEVLSKELYRQQNYFSWCFKEFVFRFFQKFSET